MFLLRQIVGWAATPMAIALFVAALGLLCRLIGRRTLSIWLVGVGAGIAYLGSTDLVGDALLRPLERSFPPLAENALPADVRDIVVLGAGYSPRGGLPVTAALDEDGLARITEGVRLQRLIAAARLIVSGGSSDVSRSPAYGYARLARALGVEEGRLIISAGSLNTEAEARATAARLGTTPFLLVTSASHMPRAMRLMRAAGARPIAAPTVQRGSARAPGDIRRYLPSAAALRNSERALHEYVGLAALATGLD